MHTMGIAHMKCGCKVTTYLRTGQVFAGFIYYFCGYGLADSNTLAKFAAGTNLKTYYL